MTRTTRIAALIAAAAALTAAGMAQAQMQHPQPQAHAAQPAVSLEQAIAAAEKHHPGSRAVESDLDYDFGRAVYEVEVLTPQHEKFEVKVDANTGKVLSSRRDD